jgi:hypothetical protein
MVACREHLHFPPELIAAILDCLQDDKKALSACSLVCHAWIVLARDHLFADLTINARRLHRMTTSIFNLTYAPFIRHLRINCPSVRHRSAFWHYAVPLITTLTFPRILSLSVTHLVACSFDKQLAFLRQFSLVASLTLDIVKLNRFADLVEILRCFPRLEHLNVKSLGLWESWDTPGGPQPLPLSHLPSTLSTLHLPYLDDGDDLLLMWLLSFPEPVLLRSLHIRAFFLSQGGCDRINNLLPSLGPSLEVFQCGTSYTTGTFVSCIRSRKQC